MPNATGHQDAARSVVFAPLDGTGRAELVEQRLTDAIVSGVLRDGERLPSESELSRSLGRRARHRARGAGGHARPGARAHPARTRRRELRDLRPRRGCPAARDPRARALAHRAARPGSARRRRSPAPPRRSPPTARATTTSRRCSPSTTAPTCPPPAAPAAHSAGSSSKWPRSASLRDSCARRCGCRARPDRCSGCACANRSTVTSAPRPEPA